MFFKAQLQNSGIEHVVSVSSRIGNRDVSRTSWDAQRYSSQIRYEHWRLFINSCSNFASRYFLIIEKALK